MEGLKGFFVRREFLRIISFMPEPDFVDVSGVSGGVFGSGGFERGFDRRNANRKHARPDYADNDYRDKHFEKRKASVIEFFPCFFIGKSSFFRIRSVRKFLYFESSDLGFSFTTKLKSAGTFPRYKPMSSRLSAKGLYCAGSSRSDQLRSLLAVRYSPI